MDIPGGFLGGSLWFGFPARGQTPQQAVLSRGTEREGWGGGSGREE